MHDSLRFKCDTDELLDMLRAVAARPINAEREMLVEAILAELNQRGLTFVTPARSYVSGTVH
jgi:hypothetical protein